MTETVTVEMILRDEKFERLQTKIREKNLSAIIIERRQTPGSGVMVNYVKYEMPESEHGAFLLAADEMMKDLERERNESKK